MPNHTNIKLYGGEFLQYIQNSFDVKDEKHVIDTWKVLTNYKNYDKFGYWESSTQRKKSRLENLLWRKWHMNHNNSYKINFNMQSIQRSTLSGKIVVFYS